MRVLFNAIKNKNECDGGSSYMWPYPLVQDFVQDLYQFTLWNILIGFSPGYLITLILIWVSEFLSIHHVNT